MADMEKSSPSSPSPTNPAGPTCACGAGPMRWLWLIIIVAAVVFLVTRGNNDAGGDGIVWRSDYEQALSDAKVQDKPVLLVFHADWCGPCKQMKKDAYTDPAVIAAAEPYIRVYIDTDKQPEVAEKFTLSGIPAYRLLTPSGEVMSSLSGTQSPDLFASWLQKGLEKKQDVTPQDKKAVIWGSDYQKAMDEAKSQNKPVLIVFHAKWCGPCRQMKSDTYSDPAVVTAAEPFVRVYIDTDEQPDVSQKYNVSGIPAFHVLSSNGDVVDSTVGYQTPDEFTAWLKQSLEKTKG